MEQKLGRIFLLICLNLSVISYSQANGPKQGNTTDFKSDSTFDDFYKLRFKVAQAQIVSLKNGGALLFRLKTNSNNIARLKASGNIDLATHLEKETRERNQIIIKSFRELFTFCPVYFFLSDYSDSVKIKKLDGIFVDDKGDLDPNIKCNAKFYLIAESGPCYDSSLGLVKESQADKAIEKGTATFESNIIIRNRYFIQLHKPFPYSVKGHSMKGFANDVVKLQRKWIKFYEKSSGIIITPDIQEYVY